MTDEFQMIAGLREEYSMIGILDLETERVHMRDVFSQELMAFKEVEDIAHVRRYDGTIASYRFNLCYGQKDRSKIVLAIKDISDIVEWARNK